MGRYLKLYDSQSQFEREQREGPVTSIMVEGFDFEFSYDDYTYQEDDVWHCGWFNGDYDDLYLYTTGTTEAEAMSPSVGSEAILETDEEDITTHITAAYHDGTKKVKKVTSIIPGVAYVTEEGYKDVYYNNAPENDNEENLIVKFTTTAANEKTIIALWPQYQGLPPFINYIDKIFVDGVEYVEEVNTSTDYRAYLNTFATPGTHIVKYHLVDGTIPRGFLDAYGMSHLWAEDIARPVITEVKLPASTELINANAFAAEASHGDYGTGPLDNITCYSTVMPEMNGNPFQDISSTGTLYYPQGSDYSDLLEMLGNGWTGVTF